MLAVVILAALLAAAETSCTVAARTTVLFPLGTSVRGIRVPNAEVVERVEPSRSIVQVVAKTNSAKAVQAFAEERLGVKVRVAPYPSDL